MTWGPPVPRGEPRNEPEWAAEISRDLASALQMALRIFRGLDDPSEAVSGRRAGWAELRNRLDASMPRGAKETLALCRGDCLISRTIARPSWRYNRLVTEEATLSLSLPEYGDMRALLAAAVMVRSYATENVAWYEVRADYTEARDFAIAPLTYAQTCKVAVEATTKEVCCVCDHVLSRCHWLSGRPNRSPFDARPPEPEQKSAVELVDEINRMLTNRKAAQAPPEPEVPVIKRKFSKRSE